MKKILLIATMLCLVFAFSACGDSGSDNGSEGTSEKKESIEAGKVELLDSGYSIKSSDGDVYVYWGVQLQNKSKETAYEFPEITVTAYDDKDEVLATEDQTMGLIQPEEKQSFGSFLDCNGKKPSKVTFDVDTGDEEDVTDDTIAASDFEISGTNERIDSEYGEATYTGKLKNKSKNDCESAAVCLLLKKDGKIVYGTTTYIDDVGAGKEKPFEISEYDVPEHDSYEITAYNWM